jgi:hypothetical protein
LLFYGVERPFLALREHVLRQASIRTPTEGHMARVGTDAA